MPAREVRMVEDIEELRAHQEMPAFPVRQWNRLQNVGSGVEVTGAGVLVAILGAERGGIGNGRYVTSDPALAGFASPFEWQSK